MSSGNPSTPKTLIECFAAANNFIISAAAADGRVANLLPTATKLFLQVSSRPDARSPVKLGAANPRADYPSSTDSHIVLLHKAILVLTLCAFECPKEVSQLILHISEVMDPPKPDGFAPTIVGVETSLAVVDMDKEKLVDLTVVDTNEDQEVGDGEVSAANAKKKNKPGPIPNTSVHPSSSPSSLSMEKRTDTKKRKDRRRKERDSSEITDTNSNELLLEQPIPKKKKTDRRMSDGTASLQSSPGSTTSSKMGAQDTRKKDRGKKTPTPRNSMSGDEGGLKKSRKKDDKTVQSSPSSIDLTSGDDEAESDQESETKHVGKIKYKTVVHRCNLFKKVMEYKPTSKVIASETYLAIIYTNSYKGLYLQMRKENKDRDWDFDHFTKIDRIVLIPRPANGFMSYCISGLDHYMHGTIHSGSEQESWFKEATSHIDVVVLKEGVNFENEKWGIKVRYNDEYLDKFRSRFISLFPGITGLMKDSSASSQRKVPAVTCGWSTSNPHCYKSNRYTVLGNIQRFLVHPGVSSLSKEETEEIAAMICRIVKNYSPNGKCKSPFYHSDPGYRDARKNFATEFLSSLGARIAIEEGIEEYFQAEAVSLILNNYVSFHSDGMNDSTPGCNNTLSYSVTVPITEELSKVAGVKKAMKVFHLDVGDPLSFSILLYSRRVILDFVKKDAVMKSMLDGSTKGTPNPSRFLIVPLLKAITRVKSYTNTNAIWDDHDIIESYKLLAKVDREKTQYRGYYCPLVAGFDKMRYWSPVRYLADVLHARNVLPMTKIHMMGYVCFAALETNGTFLLSGIIDDALCCVDPRHSTFIKEVHSYGMYAALIFAGSRKNKGNGTGNIYGSSKVPRHQHHNRGSKAFPIAGQHGLDIEDKDAVGSYCKQVVMQMIGICNEFCQEAYNIRVRKSKHAFFQTIADAFFQKVQKIAGKGVGHIFTLNFCQVASLFGFLPMEMTEWATVRSKTSGAYKAINSFYAKDNCTNVNSDITEELAEEHFEKAVTWVRCHVNFNFNLAIAENILCELHRENCEDVDSDNYQQSPKKDVLYMYGHRRGVIHPLYRWKSDSRQNIVLQVLNITKDGIVEGIHDVMVLRRGSIRLEGEDEESWTSWIGDKYDLSPQYCSYLL